MGPTLRRSVVLMKDLFKDWIVENPRMTFLLIALSILVVDNWVIGLLNFWGRKS